MEKLESAFIFKPLQHKGLIVKSWRGLIQHKEIMEKKVIAFKKIFESKKYDHDNMVKKLKYMSGSLETRSTVEQYLDILTEIYNMRLKSESKIHFDGTTEIVV